MARNKVIDHARQHHRERARTQAATNSQLERAAAEDTIPSQQVARRELFQEIWRRLSLAERQLADLRNQGLDWATIAATVGGTAPGRRKQLERALNWVARELGLDDDTG